MNSDGFLSFFQGSYYFKPISWCLIILINYKIGKVCRLTQIEGIK